MLPDDVLLAIFDLYRTNKKGPWETLVHVCRRWRCLVFGSPRRLKLRLVCTPRTPARESLDIWPALPLVVEGRIVSSTPVDNIIAALGHSDRVRGIYLHGATRSLQWDKVFAAMQVPFPALTGLLLLCKNEQGLVIPDTFLGGSASRLRYLHMDYIPFPGIHNLLLSATHLTDLELSRIPHSGYISPEGMATCLSVMTSLDSLSLEFLSSRSRRPLPPMTRSILPNLTHFWFKGASEYLDDLVARVDAPQLDYLHINFLLQTNFDTPHLVQFISRTPRFQEPNEAYVSLHPYPVVRLSEDGECRVEFLCEESGPQVSYITWVCTMCLPPLRTVEKLRLEVSENDLSYSGLDWIDDVEDDQWLELLHPFTAVKNLHLFEEFQPKTASALQELVGGRTTEVLPSLQNIFLESFKDSGPFQEAIRPFVAAREVSGHPIAVLPS